MKQVDSAKRNLDPLAASVRSPSNQRSSSLIWTATATAGVTLVAAALFSWLHPAHGEQYDNLFVGLAASVVVAVCALVALAGSVRLLLRWYRTGWIRHDERLAAASGVVLALVVVAFASSLVFPRSGFH